MILQNSKQEEQRTYEEPACADISGLTWGQKLTNVWPHIDLQSSSDVDIDQHCQPVLCQFEITKKASRLLHKHATIKVLFLPVPGIWFIFLLDLMGLHMSSYILLRSHGFGIGAIVGFLCEWVILYICSF